MTDSVGNILDVADMHVREETNHDPRICIEEGCTSRTPPRHNWHTMSEDYQLEASSHHHRCRRCYAGWLATDARRQVLKWTRARKRYNCEGCKSVIREGRYYALGERSTGPRRYLERVHVCNKCIERYTQKPTPVDYHPKDQHVSTDQA